MTISQTDKPTPPKPLRLWPGVVAVVLQCLLWVRCPHRGARGRHRRAAWRTRLRVGGPRLVVVLQQGPLVRARGRHRADGRRARRDKAHRSRVHCGRDDGDDVAHLRHPGPEPCIGVLGGGQSSALKRTAARGNGRHHTAGVRGVHASADRRPDRRCRFGFPLAVDQDSRGTAIGSTGTEQEKHPVQPPAPAAVPPADTASDQDHDRAGGSHVSPRRA